MGPLVKVLVDPSKGGEEDGGFEPEDDGKKGQGYPDLSLRFLCSSLQILFSRYITGLAPELTMGHRLYPIH